MTLLRELLVVGLGNPPLPNTRHSVGHLVVNALAARFGISMAADRATGGYVGHGNITSQDIPISLTLFKSKSLMNISGQSVVAALRKTVRSPESMIVIQDSLSHRAQTLSVKLGGSANGHNGIKSVMAALGGDGFYRFRIGIGRDQSDPADFVLQKLSTSERTFWGDGGQGLDNVIHEIHKIAMK